MARPVRKSSRNSSASETRRNTSRRSSPDVNSLTNGYENFRKLRENSRTHNDSEYAQSRRLRAVQREGGDLEDRVESSSNSGIYAVGAAALGAAFIAYLNNTESGERLTNKIDSVMELWKQMDGDLVKENIDDAYAIIRGNYSFDELDTPEVQAYLESAKGTPEYENFYKMGERFVKIDNIVYPMAYLTSGLINFIS